MCKPSTIKESLQIYILNDQYKSQEIIKIRLPSTPFTELVISHQILQQKEEKKRKRKKPTTRSITESHYSVERCNDSSTFDLSAAITPSLPSPFHPAIGRNGTKKKMGRVEKAKGETDERKNRWKGKEGQVAESELQSITLARMTARIAASPLVITVRRFTAGRLLYSRIHVDGWRIREPLHDRISTAEEDDIPSCNLLGVATARPFYRPGKLVRLRDEARPVSPMENQPCFPKSIPSVKVCRKWYHALWID